MVLADRHQRGLRDHDDVLVGPVAAQAGAQPAQWLVAGDVAMSAAYNGRIASAQKEGMKLSIVWPQSLYDPEYWAVVKGTPNKALAEKFNDAITQIRANGTYKKVQDKYFAFDVYGH